MTRFVNYWKFVWKQLCNLSLPEYMLYTFGLGIQLAMFISAPITLQTTLTFIGTNLSLLCVLAITQCRQINGIVGLLSAVCFIIIGYQARNYLSIGEQLVYAVTLDIPVLVMGTDWVKKAASRIRHLDLKGWIVTILGTALWAWLCEFVMANYTNDARPTWDAIAFAIATASSILTTFKFRDAYFGWVFGSLSQMVLWYLTYKQGGTATPAMLLNYFAFFLNDVISFTHSSWFSKKYQKKQISSDSKLYD